MFTRRLSVLPQKYPAVFLKNFLSGKCVFQIGPLRRTQMDLCKVWYFCKKPNRTCQVAEEQKEMVTSLKVHQQKNTEDKIRLAVTYCLHASLILRTSSSRKVEGKRKKKPKQREIIQEFLPAVYLECPHFPLTSWVHAAYGISSLTRPLTGNISKLPGLRWMKLNDK